MYYVPHSIMSYNQSVLYLYCPLPASSNGGSPHTESAVQTPPDAHLDRAAAAHHNAGLGAGDDDDAVRAGGG